MVKYLPRPEVFPCAICGRQQPPEWDNPFIRAIHPFCWFCESYLGKGASPVRGTDARITRQLSAIAEILTCTANCINNGSKPPYA